MLPDNVKEACQDSGGPRITPVFQSYILLLLLLLLLLLYRWKGLPLLSIFRAYIMLEALKDFSFFGITIGLQLTLLPDLQAY